ncbi:MAG: tRNA lysidine(34) synthetase TilS [Anaerolineae bacterium]
MSLVEQALATIDTHHLFTEGGVVVVGVSGGSDSLCLLHLLRTLEKHHLVLHAAHLNHGIRGDEADADAAYVGNLCQEWGIICSIERVDVPALARELHLSLEEAARKARYAFLYRTAQRTGATVVAVGHHADDQAETVLMHLLRGAGLAGLRGMRPLCWLCEENSVSTEAEPRCTPTIPIRLVRPLLRVARAQIDEYCATHYLQPRLDRTNLDTTLFRNRLRHHLLPLLEEYNPNIRQILVHTADVVGADMELLDTLVTQTWNQVVEKESPQAVRYNLRALRALPIGLQRSVLRRGVGNLRHSLRDLSYLHLESALNVLNNGVTGKKVNLPKGLVLTLGYEQAILCIEQDISNSGRWLRLSSGHPIAVPLGDKTVNSTDGWQLTAVMVPRANLYAYEKNDDRYAAFFAVETIDGDLSLGTRAPGDYLFPLGMSGHRQKLHDLMINAKVPEAERDTVPVLRVGKEIAWVVGLRQDERFAVTEQTEMVLCIQFQTIKER